MLLPGLSHGHLTCLISEIDLVTPALEMNIADIPESLDFPKSGVATERSGRPIVRAINH